LSLLGAEAGGERCLGVATPLAPEPDGAGSSSSSSSEEELVSTSAGLEGAAEGAGLGVKASATAAKLGDCGDRSGGEAKAFGDGVGAGEGGPIAQEGGLAMKLKPKVERPADGEAAAAGSGLGAGGASERAAEEAGAAGFLALEGAVAGAAFTAAAFTAAACAGAASTGAASTGAASTWAASTWATCTGEGGPGAGRASVAARGAGPGGERGAWFRIAGRMRSGAGCP